MKTRANVSRTISTGKISNTSRAPTNNACSSVRATTAGCTSHACYGEFSRRRKEDIFLSEKFPLQLTADLRVETHSWKRSQLSKLTGNAFRLLEIFAFGICNSLNVSLYAVHSNFPRSLFRVLLEVVNGRVDNRRDVTARLEASGYNWNEFPEFESEIY